MVKCPYCGSEKSNVNGHLRGDTEGKIMRYRVCKVCGRRFKTVEVNMLTDGSTFVVTENQVLNMIYNTTQEMIARLNTMKK